MSNRHERDREGSAFTYSSEGENKMFHCELKQKKKN